MQSEFRSRAGLDRGRGTNRKGKRDEAMLGGNRFRLNAAGLKKYRIGARSRDLRGSGMRGYADPAGERLGRTGVAVRNDRYCRPQGQEQANVRNPFREPPHIA